MQVCPNLLFTRVSRSILSVLHTFIHRTLSARCSVFFVLFSQCDATIHPQSAFVTNNKSPLHSFCLQENQMSVSYSGALPPCYIVLTCSLSLPPSAPCYLWKTKLPENRKVAWRYTLPAAKRCNHCQEFDRKPSVTSATPPPLHTILLPTRLTLLFEDGAMTWCWRECLHHTCTNVDKLVYFRRINIEAC